MFLIINCTVASVLEATTLLAVTVIAQVVVNFTTLDSWLLKAW